MKNAYMTLVMKGDFYIPGALVLAHSLRRTKTPHAIVCMVTSDVMNTDALRAVFDRVVTVEYISGNHHPIRDMKTRKKYIAWESLSLTQHQCLQFAEYGKVCFLDADVVVLRNMDSVFDLSTPAGMFYEKIPNGIEKHTDRIHGETVKAEHVMECLKKGLHVCIANCLLFTPGQEIYREFRSFLERFYRDNENMYGFKEPDGHVQEQMIAYFYAKELGVDWTFVGLSYQTVPWKYIDPEKPLYLFHYMSSKKPWQQRHPNKFTKPWFDEYRRLIKKYPRMQSIFSPQTKNET